MIRLVAEDCGGHEEPRVAHVRQIVAKQRDIDWPLIVERDNLDIADVARAIVDFGRVELAVRYGRVTGNRGKVRIRLDVDVNAVRAVKQSVDVAAYGGFE